MDTKYRVAAPELVYNRTIGHADPKPDIRIPKGRSKRSPAPEPASVHPKGRAQEFIVLPARHPTPHRTEDVL